jgi:hypothetical protein
MTTKKKRWLIRLAGALWLPVGAMGSPKVAIDTVEVKFDTVYEKKNRFLSHAFGIKNLGDSTVTIYNIRPQCGCTTFEVDSFIQPGKVGHITMQLQLSEMEDGPFYKYLKISTNDPRFPRARFGFSGVYKPIIRVDPASVVLPTVAKKDTAQTVTLYTEKPDLQVTQVAFIQDNASVEWMSTVPIRYQFSKTGKKNTAGQWLYLLQVFYSRATGASRYGKFIITTNHPDKPELKIPGVLEPGK